MSVSRYLGLSAVAFCCVSLEACPTLAKSLRAAVGVPAVETLEALDIAFDLPAILRVVGTTCAEPEQPVPTPWRSTPRCELPATMERGFERTPIQALLDQAPVFAASI